IGADAESQRQHDGRREAWGPAKSAQGVANVLPEVVEPRCAARGAAGHSRGHVAEAGMIEWPDSPRPRMVCTRPSASHDSNKQRSPSPGQTRGRSWGCETSATYGA